MTCNQFWVLLILLSAAACARREVTPTATALPRAKATDEPAALIAGDWERIEPGGETRCAHDTDYAFWARRGVSDRLVVYLEGGGGCWSAETCAPGSSFYDADVGADDDPARRGGVFDLDNPDNPFADDTILFVPSCTGDVHWGDRVRAYEAADGATRTIYHRGFVNASAALKWAATNLATPERVFVTGCSAGSAGSILLTPYVIAQYPEANVNQLGDSLAFVFHRPVEMNEDYGAAANWPTWIPALAELDPGAFLMADFYTSVAAHYPDQSFAQYNTQGDQVQARYYSAIGGEADGFTPDLLESLSTIHAGAPNFRSYTAAGAQHCILPRPSFYTLTTDGVRLRDWVAALADGKPVDSVRCADCPVDLE